jgi:hypothetical protein
MLSQVTEKIQKGLGGIGSLKVTQEVRHGVGRFEKDLSEPNEPARAIMALFKDIVLGCPLELNPLFFYEGYFKEFYDE